jgi:hypothetical protein
MKAAHARPPSHRCSRMIPSLRKRNKTMSERAFFEHFQSSSAKSMRKTASSWRATKRRSVDGRSRERGSHSQGAPAALQVPASESRPWPIIVGVRPRGSRSYRHRMDVAVFEPGKIHALYPFSRKPRAVGAERRLTLKRVNTPKHEAHGRSTHLGNAEQGGPTVPRSYPIPLVVAGSCRHASLLVVGPWPGRVIFTWSF